MTELFTQLVHDRSDEIDVDEEAFFLHQFGKTLLDPFARDDPAEGGDHALAFLRQRPVVEQCGGVGIGRVAREHEKGSGKPYCYFVVCELSLRAYGSQSRLP